MVELTLWLTGIASGTNNVQQGNRCGFGICRGGKRTGLGFSIRFQQFNFQVRWWECKIKPNFCLISCELKPLNARRNFWRSDRILNQYEELMLNFRSTSWWTQNWWSDSDLCTKNAIDECFIWLIQPPHPSLCQTFWLACHKEVEVPLNFHLIVPYETNKISFDAFSVLITEFFSSRVGYLMICFCTNMTHKRKQMRDHDYRLLWIRILPLRCPAEGSS